MHSDENGRAEKHGGSEVKGSNPIYLPTSLNNSFHSSSAFKRSLPIRFNLNFLMVS